MISIFKHCEFNILYKLYSGVRMTQVVFYRLQSSNQESITTFQN